MIVPVVTGDLDPAAIEDLIALCVRYDQARHAPQDGQPQDGQPQAAAQDGQPDAIGQPDASQPPAGGTGTRDGTPGGTASAEVLDELEQQILARVIQIMSGPGGLASFLRSNLLGKPLAGPSLPLDVGQTDDIPITCAAWWRCGTRAAATQADASSKHTLTAWARCRPVRRVCR